MAQGTLKLKADHNTSLSSVCALAVVYGPRYLKIESRSQQLERRCMHKIVVYGPRYLKIESRSQQKLPQYDILYSCLWPKVP